MFIIEILPKIPELRELFIICMGIASFGVFFCMLVNVKYQLEREPVRETSSERQTRLNKYKWFFVFSMLPFVNFLLIPYWILTNIWSGFSSAVVGTYRVFREIFKY